MKTNLRTFLAALSVLLVCFAVGCESEEPSNMLEGMNEESLADYDKMLEDDAKAMSEAKADDE